MLGGAGGDISEKLAEMEKKFNECCQHVASLDTNFNNQIGIFHMQYADLEKEIGCIVEKLNSW